MASLSVYVESTGCWYSPRQPHTEILGPSFILKLEVALGVPGLAGVNRLFGLMAVSQLQAVERQLARDLHPGSEVGKVMETAENVMKDSSHVITSPSKTFTGLCGRVSRQLQSLHSALSTVGQLTQLRREVCCRLMSASKFDSKLLHSSLQTMQEAVLLSSTQEPGSQFPPDGESELLAELTTHLQWAGLEDPSRQVYITVERSGLTLYTYHVTKLKGH